VIDWPALTRVFVTGLCLYSGISLTLFVLVVLPALIEAGEEPPA